MWNNEDIIEEYLISKNIFEINLENIEKNLTLKCDLYGPELLFQCYLNTIIKSRNTKERFFYLGNQLEKSFQVILNEEIEYLTIEIKKKSYLKNNYLLDLLDLIGKNNYHQINLFHILYNNIPIAYGLNNRYIYPAIVSITSIMETIISKKKYDFYIIHSGDFSGENKKKLKSLEKNINNVA